MTITADGETRSQGPTAVIHVPHASTRIPADVRDQFVLSDEQIADEIRLMTDHLTDELFAVPEAMALAVRFPVSRLVVDPERFESDEQEPMAARGMGVVYERTCRQTPLRRPLTASERQALIERWYRPHHQALTAAVATVLQTQDTCLIIDAHSFPSIPLPYEADQDADRPDICIGSDDVHTPPVLTTPRRDVVPGSGMDRRRESAVRGRTRADGVFQEGCACACRHDRGQSTALSR